MNNDTKISTIMGQLNKKMGGLKTMVQAHGDQRFFVHNGPTLQNLRELKEALQIMTDAQYEYHADEFKNDFAAWVEIVLQDKQCAAALREAEYRQQAARVIQKFLRYYR